jgi:hypothetical protein
MEQINLTSSAIFLAILVVLLAKGIQSFANISAHHREVKEKVWPPKRTGSIEGEREGECSILAGPLLEHSHGILRHQFHIEKFTAQTNQIDT